MDLMERLKRNVISVLASPVKTYRDILDEERDLIIPAGIVLFGLIVRWISYYLGNRVVERGATPQIIEELFSWVTLPQLTGVEGFLFFALLSVLDFLFFTYFAYGLSRGLNKDVTLKGFFELLAYAQIPMIIGEAMFFLPSVLFEATEGIFGLWSLGLEVLAIRESIKTSTVKAIIVYVAAGVSGLILDLVMLIALAILLKLLAPIQGLI